MLKHDWTEQEVQTLFNTPFNDLMFEAQTVHRENFDPNTVQTSTLLSIKTGACPEDCSYCPQSGHYNTGLEKERLLPVETVLEKAKAAKDAGATRFCMGGAWRSPPAKAMSDICDMVKGVKALGLEACATLGMLDDIQVHQLKDAGLDFYNHNLDSSREYYEKSVVTTRQYDDRLDTLERVRNAEIQVCCGGIVGMGEARKDRVNLLRELANLPAHPMSVPINRLVPVPGTPYAEMKPIEDFEFVRTIAVARIMMPKSYVRLSAGREEMNETMQSLCFLAGANSIFYGDKLLTTGNPDAEKDRALFTKLGIQTLVLAESGTALVDYA